MLETKLSRKIPESKEDCDKKITCDQCLLMYETLHGERLPHCLNFNKSMMYIQEKAAMEDVTVN